MKLLFHNYYDSLNLNNALFTAENSEIGDNLLKPLNVLAAVFEQKKYSIGTYTKIPLEEADAFVFIDYPKPNDKVFEYAKNAVGKKKYLLILESPIVNFDNFDVKLHDIFDLIFTWSDVQVEFNPAKYRKIFYSFDIPTTIPTGLHPKFCTVISGNKRSKQPNELYSERLKCIKWYEKNAPTDFDLYGTNWSNIKFNNEAFAARVLNRINTKLNLFKHNFSVYKGKIDRKHAILAQYKFCICFENVCNHRGYITEKVFDCFFAGTIPIYKGASNILDYIPQNCFIDYNKFSSVAELHQYLKSLSADEVIEYQFNILKFLNSEDAQKFSIASFCKTLILAIH